MRREWEAKCGRCDSIVTWYSDCWVTDTETHKRPDGEPCRIEVPEFKSFSFPKTATPLPRIDVADIVSVEPMKAEGVRFPLEYESEKNVSDVKAVWKFHWDCGRQGAVTGVFVATEAQVQAAIGKYVSFGEILGKHSDVSGTIEQKDLIKVSDDPSVVSVIETYRLSSGYNPLQYLSEE